MDKITGYFKPIKESDLTQKAKVCIGKKMEFQKLWIIKEEDGTSYTGQRAYQALGKHRMLMGWIPECDIEVCD